MTGTNKKADKTKFGNPAEYADEREQKWQHCCAAHQRRPYEMIACKH